AQAREQDGTPIPGDRVELQPAFQRWSVGEYQSKALPTQTVVTGPDGKASATVIPPRSGEIRLLAKAVDRKGRAIYGKAYVWAADDSGSDLETQYADLSILTDRRRYRAGETARVLINAQYAGPSVLLAVEGH